ncbi:MAG: PqqD family protein [Chloroflexota bacterium]
MTDLQSILSHSPSIVTRKTGSEYVLVPLSDNIADMNSVYTLNETGAFLWEQIDGRRTVGEIVAALTAEYETSDEEAEADVMEFIGKLDKYLIIK